MEEEERVLQIQDLEVRNKGGDREVFITGTDENRRASR